MASKKKQCEMFLNVYLDGILDEFKKKWPTDTKLDKDFPYVKYVYNAPDPDYRILDVQQLYALRYTYSYAYHYQKTYESILDVMLKHDVLDNKKTIRVLSIGCGTMIDYWSLSRALFQKNLRNKVRVEYMGIDINDWDESLRFDQDRTVSKGNYDLHYHSGNDDVRFECGDAFEYLKKPESYDYDIYMFPMSISELEKTSQYPELLDWMSCPKFTHDPVFFVLTERRVNEGEHAGEYVVLSNDWDLVKFDQLRAALGKHLSKAGNSKCSSVIQEEVTGGQIGSADKKFTNGSLEDTLKEIRKTIEIYINLYGEDAVLRDVTNDKHIRTKTFIKTDLFDDSPIMAAPNKNIFDQIFEDLAGDDDDIPF